MGTIQDHRSHAAQCVAQAEKSDNERDKALWLTLAQSWVRLAEHVSRKDLGDESDTPLEHAGGDTATLTET